jgi:hypothetical protein
MNTSNNIYNILKTLASLEPQPPKQESMLKQLNEGVTPPNPLSLKDRLAQKLAEAKEVDEDMLTPKEKKFANLAPPKDKVTYADKIAGAKKGDKKDVDEGADKQTMSRAAKGNEKYGKDGMKALAKAGKEGKSLEPIKAKYNKYDESVNEGEYQDGPNKSDVPAFQRKAKAAPGDDSWKTSQQDLDDEASKSPTGAAGLAKAKARLGMNEAIDYEKVLEAIAALYGDDMWENDAMGDLAQDLEQAGPTDRELDFIIAKGKLPTRLKNIRFTNSDDVQFGHMDEDSGDPQIKPGMKTQYGTVVSVEGNTVTVKASNGELTTVNITDIDQAMGEGGMREEQYDENNAHSSLPGTRRVSDKEHSEYDAAAHTVRKWMRKRGWNPKSEFKSAMKYIMDNLDSKHDDTLTNEVKEACKCCAKHHGGIVDESGLDMNLLKGMQNGMKGVNTDPESERNSGKKYGYRNDRDDTGKDDDYDEHGNEKKGAKKSAPSDAPKTKGRPKKNFGPERTTAKAYKHKGSRVAESINLETYVEDTMAELESIFVMEKAKSKKPNFLDMGKDGNKKESIKSAASDKDDNKKKNPFGNKKDVKESKQQLTENTLQAIVRRFGKEVREFAQDGEFDQDLFEALYDYYFDDMPYGVKKGRDGDDPYEWIGKRFHEAIEGGDVEISETRIHDSLNELARLAGLPSAMDEQATDEGNEFSGARADAIRAGKNSFEVGGNSYNVTDAEDEQMNEGGCNMTAEGQYCEMHGMNECGMMEGAKPDYADIDGDNDEKESMKDAAKDKEGDSDDKEDLEEQCGMPPMGGMMGSELESGMSINTSMDTKTGRKTVTVTADGEAAEELASMLRMAGMGGGQQPEHHELKIAIPTDASEVEEEYANQPDERTAPVSAVTAGGNDLNKKKTMYKHNYRGGDNPMSIKEHGVEARLARMLDRIKAKG